MVDKFDLEDDDTNYTPNRDRGGRPNALRLLNPYPRMPPPFMIRHILRPPFIPRFNNFNPPNRHEGFPPRVMMYGPKKYDNKTGGGRVETTNQFPNRCLNRDFLERNAIEQQQNSQKNPDDVIADSDSTENKFVSADEEEIANETDLIQNLNTDEDKNNKSELLNNDKEIRRSEEKTKCLLDTPLEGLNDTESSSNTEGGKSTKAARSMSELISNVDKSQNIKKIDDKIKHKGTSSLNNNDDERPMTLLENKSVDRTHRSQYYERHYGSSSTYDRRHGDRLITAPARNDPQLYGTIDDKLAYERRNLSTSFERRNVSPFERRPPYERSNDLGSPYEERPFERPLKRVARSDQPFDRLNPARKEHNGAFERYTSSRSNELDDEEYCNNFDRSGGTRAERSTLYDRDGTPPDADRLRSERSAAMYDRHDSRAERTYGFERGNNPNSDQVQMFDRQGGQRSERPPMFERQAGPPIYPGAVDPAHAMHHLPRPPPFMHGRMPHPHFPGMPPMPAPPALPHPPSAAGSSAPVPPPIPYPGSHPMPPFRPEFFDPRLRFMPRPPERPLMPGERPLMPPMFPIPGQFRPPYGQMLPPPHLLHRPQLSIKADPNIKKPEKPVTLATLNEEEVWVQNPTSDGRFYFYSSKTRQTKWERPEGVKIITQAELNNLLATNTQTVKALNPEKPPEVAEWTEYKAPDGRPYFHNRRTAVTTWDMPQVLVNWKNGAPTEMTTTVISTVATKPAAEVIPTTITNTIAKAKESEPERVKTPLIAPVAATTKESHAPTLAEYVSQKPRKQAEVEVSKASEEPEPSVDEEAKERDRSKPVSSTAISGSPWCIVWTGDGRVFYFNPAHKVSVWERPEELKDREDVDKILEDASKELADMLEELQREEPPAKRIKTEETDVVEETVKEDEKMDTVELAGKEDIALGKEPAKEAEEKAAKERALLPLETRMAQFREMLVEKQVSAFSTWEKELHKIVFDVRYLLLASRERKLAFENFVKDRAEEERRDKKNQAREKKEQFKKLLKEATLTTKSIYSEFATQFAKDDRFLGVEKTREKESMFQDFIDELRKKEKDEKSKEREKTKQAFVALLKEQKVTSRSHWSDVRKKIDTDARYKAVDSSSRREDWFKEHVKRLPKEASEEGEGPEATFKAILAEAARDPNDQWADVKRAVRKDSRWADIEDKLDRDARDDIFKEHIAALKKRQKRK